MTHQSGFSLAVKDSNRKTLREYDGKVYLPFNSEYSLFMKNSSDVRAKITVSIDGTDVLGGDAIVLNAHSSIDLERFIPSDRKFLFVPLTDSRVQDPTESKNGLIEVSCTKEWIKPTSHQINTVWAPNYRYTIDSPFGKPMCFSKNTTNVGSVSGMFTSSIGGNVRAGCFVNDMSGATVQGSKSHQQFTTVSDFPLESISTVLWLRLCGNEHSITAQETKRIHCTACGHKCRLSDNFCGSCGVKLSR